MHESQRTKFDNRIDLATLSLIVFCANFLSVLKRDLVMLQYLQICRL